MSTCPVMTHPGRYDPPEPQEFCENDVEDGEDFCPQHMPDEPDWDAIRKDRLIEERLEG